MLAGIIQTIIMALGIATGNVSSNVYKGGNVFNDENRKPQIKKEAEYNTLANIQSYIRVQRIDNHDDLNNPNVENSEKYYYRDPNDVIGNANYYNEYLRIYNTTYTYNKTRYENNYNNYSIAELVSIIQIDNYSPTALVNIRIHNRIQMESTSDSFPYPYTYRSTQIRKDENENFTSYIDRTLTLSNSANEIYEEIEQDTNGIILEETNNEQLNANVWLTDPNYSDTYYYVFANDFTIPYIDSHSNIQIVILNKMVYDRPQAQNYYGVNFYWNFADRETDNDQTYITISGYQDTIVINTEVVDIPGIMFTVLTMPFSFISTAFNLTIFPGTPYQVNFTNLFMILLATFILLWIIKKVF